MRIALFLLSFLALASSQAAVATSPVNSKALTGDWYGGLNVPGGVLHVQLTIREENPGALSAVLVSIDQGGATFPVSTLSATSDSLHLSVPTLGGTFAGRIHGEGKAAEIEGAWSQNGATLPLTFKRTGKPAEPKRPQVPAKPYPYRDESVSYQNTAAGVKFAATLTLPNGPGPFPAVVLITGSGAEDRDETIFGHHPFLILSDYLTRQGIATLRADDRGVGGSTGDIASATTLDFAGDALAGVAYLKTRKEIDPKHIGLIGHSEGANVASIAATQSPDIAYIVMLAGMGVPGEQVLYLQGWRLMEAQGESKASVDQERAIQEGFFSAVKEESDKTKLAKRLGDVAEKAGKKMSAAEVDAIADQIGSPWFRYFLTFDPEPVLRKVHGPVLALYAEKDTQATPKENAAAVEAALKASGNPDYSVRVLPNLNHLFQTCQTGAVAEYSQIEETLAPAALEQIAEWIQKHAATKK